MKAMKSPLVHTAVIMLMTSFACQCLASTDLCKDYAVNNEYDKAIEECTKQITGEIRVKYLEYSYSNRGAAYANKKDFDRAISDYSKAIELNSGYATAYYNRAIAYAHRNQYDEAISDYTRAIELNPNNTAAYAGREQAYARKKEHEQSAPDYNKTPPAAPIGAVTSRQSAKVAYSVQLGLFRNEDKAVALANRFRAKGYNAFVTQSSSKDKGTLFRVLIGRFEDRQTTAELAAKIRTRENAEAIIFSE